MKDRRNGNGLTMLVHQCCTRWSGGLYEVGQRVQYSQNQLHVGGNGSRSGKRNESDRLPKLVPVIWEEGATRHRKDEGR